MTNMTNNNKKKNPLVHSNTQKGGREKSSNAD